MASVKRVSRVLRIALPGLLGSAHLALAAWVLGYLPLATVTTTFHVALRNSPVAVGLAKAALIVGAGLLLHSWLSLTPALKELRLRDLRAIVLLWCIPVMFAPPLFSRDMYSYFAQGRLVYQGWDPYVIGVGSLNGWFGDAADPVWAGTPSPYGALFLAIERTVFIISHANPVVAVAWFRALALGALVALMFVVPKLASVLGADRTKALWLGLANPLIIIDVAVSGHNDTLMLVAIGTALLAAQRTVLLACVLIAVAAAIKPVAILALPFVAVTKVGMSARIRHKMPAWAAGAAVFFAVLFLINHVAGFGWGWVQAVLTPTSTHTLLSMTTLFGLALESIWTAPFVAILRVIGAAFAGLVVAFLLIKRTNWTATRALGFAFLIVVVLAPAVHSWYVLWFLPLLAASGVSMTVERLLTYGVALICTVVVASQAAITDTYLGPADVLAVIAATCVLVAAVWPYRKARER